MNVIKKELKFASNNYKSIPIVASRGKGIYVYTDKGHAYMDCIAGYSAINQGHSHERLINVVKNQIENLTLTSRAYHNDKLGLYSEKLCKTFDYEKVLLMNGGVEAGEAANKIARAWGYLKKKIPQNAAINLFVNNNFWGRSFAACSSSNDASCYKNFGPYMEGMSLIEYDNINQLEKYLHMNECIVSIMLEPIQGEGGIIIPSNKYLTRVRELCNTYNILMIVDEIQTGLGRTGKMLACDYENVKPDILCLGKALSGGFYPISATLCNNSIMDVLTPGTHGSTFGGNPLACSIGMEALDIIKDEKLCENSYKMGNLFRNNLDSFFFNKPTQNYRINEIRGRGLLNAIDFFHPVYAKNFVKYMLEEKVLLKTTRENVVRITPPLVINETEINILCDKIIRSINKL
jgi:ornithine--oxo-acid transaminase